MAKLNSFNSWRNKFGLIILSLVSIVAIQYFFGQGAEDCAAGCANMYSITGYVLGFTMIIGGVILAGITIGLIVSYLRGRMKSSDFLSHYEEDDHIPD